MIAMHKDHYHSNMQYNEESNSSFLHTEVFPKNLGPIIHTDT